MKRSFFTIIAAIFLHPQLYAQSDSLRIRSWAASGEHPLVFFISGDGGLNHFSENLCNAIHQQNMDVEGVNALQYFWKKKMPSETAKDFSAYLNKKSQARSNQRLILIGYSFGADVLPFIINNFDKDFRNRVSGVFLISPSASTDFKIHLSDMVGSSNQQRGMDVLAEINKLADLKTITIFGSEEKGFSPGAVRLKNYSNYTLPGGHHYNDDIKELMTILTNHFREM